MADRAATLAAVREKYPQYGSISDDELATRLAAKYPQQYGFLAAEKVGSIPVAPKGVPVASMPGASDYGRYAKERSGDIAATVAGALMPGKGVLGLASRVLGSEAAHDLGQAITGQKVTPGMGGGSQLAGEGISKVISSVLSPLAYRNFARDSAKKLGDWLKEHVPAWAGLPATEKGLYEMAHGTGQRVLSQTYEKALQGIKGKIPTARMLEMPADDAAALGLKVSAVEPTPWMRYQAQRGGAPQAAPGMVRVDVKDVIDALPSARKMDLGLYRRTLGGVDRSLEEIETGLGKEFMKERGAYRTGAGFMDFAERGKFLHGEKYDPATAQRAFDRFGKDTLLTRSLDPVREMVRGPGKDPIEASKHNPWARRLQGAMLGEMVGLPFGGAGHVAGPVVGGALGERLLPEVTYKNVPKSAMFKMAERATAPLAAQGIREGGRLAGAEDMWP